MLVLLSLVACTPFGGRNTLNAEEAAQTAATATPVPPTPVPPLATPTGTPVQAMATPTFTVTPTPEPTATPTPTLTLTPIPAEPLIELPPAAETTTKTEEQPAAPAEGQETAPQPARAKALSTGNVVRNGSFEDGFDANGVGQGWTAFSSDDGAVFSWEPDSDPMHISHGSHAQVMRIMGPGKPNTFVGVYQTLDVVPGAKYTLALHGVIRSSLAAENHDPLAFRTQYAIDESGGTDWQAVEWAEWTDPGWDDVQLDVKWPPMDAHVIEFTPTTDKVTLFVRGWSKWAFFQSEAKFYLDGIFLQGPVPAEGMPSTGGATIWVPIAGLLAVVGLGLWQVRKRRAPAEKR
jgi:LPXTG-motif cell wall-anchored protein